jgi:hypothetical protein
MLSLALGIEEVAVLPPSLSKVIVLSFSVSADTLELLGDLSLCFWKEFIEKLSSDEEFWTGFL